MTDSAPLAAGFALLAALSFAIGSVAQQNAAAAVPDENAAGLALVRSLIKQPRWWAGLLGDFGGYLLQVVGLAFGSLLLVQPLLVSSLLFALPLSARFAKRELSVRQWVLAVLLAGSLVVFVVVGNPTEGVDNAPFAHWWPVLATVFAVIAGCAGFARASTVGGAAAGGVRALLFGAACGISFGTCVALTKPVLAMGQHDLTHLYTAWQPYALVAVGLVGFYLQQLSFQAGALSSSLPAITVAEPLTAALFGALVLGEQLRVSGLGGVLVGVCALVMTLTAVELARTESKP